MLDPSKSLDGSPNCLTTEMYGLTGVDLNSIAVIPSGTGLGPSSSFAVGLMVIYLK